MITYLQIVTFFCGNTNLIRKMYFFHGGTERIPEVGGVLSLGNQ